MRLSELKGSQDAPSFRNGCSQAPAAFEKHCLPALLMVAAFSDQLSQCGHKDDHSSFGLATPVERKHTSPTTSNKSFMIEWLSLYLCHSLGRDVGERRVKETVGMGCYALESHYRIFLHMKSFRKKITYN